MLSSSSLSCLSKGATKRRLVATRAAALGSSRIPAISTQSFDKTRHRFYFTNGEVTKRTDPYAVLGLQWGDGATSAEIKAAFREKARALHPDVNKTDTPEQAIEKFQKLQSAYESLMKAFDSSENLDLEEWRVALWRNSDRIAMDRTDVAGELRKRPVPPASTKNSTYGRELGHPNGSGRRTVRGEYLGTSKTKSSSTVGTGRNKWVTPKQFKPWKTPSE